MTRQREMNPITRAVQKPSRKHAVNAMCAHCVECTASLQGNGLTDHLEAGFRVVIRNCVATHCPLHSWRPYQKKESLQ